MCASDGSHYEKRGNGEPVCIDDEIPFGTPGSWEWARLCSLGWFGGGKTPPTSDKTLYASNGILWVTSKDMKRGVIDSTQITLSEKGAAMMDIYPIGSIVMVTRSGILRRILPVAVLAKEATVNQDQKVTVPFDESGSRWLPVVFRFFDRYIRTELGKAGTTVESVNFEQVKDMLVPIPPFLEQQRILMKYSELEVLANEYGALEEARERLDAELPGRLRRSVLQMAVQGKLVPQDPNDEPASALLERIRAERVRLAAEKKAKPPKGGESVIYRGSDGGYYEKRGKGEARPVEVPFEISESWEWARMSTLCEFGKCTNVEYDMVAPGTWNLDLEDLSSDSGQILRKKRKQNGEKGSTKHVFEAGMVLYSKLRPYLNKVVIADENGVCTSEILPLQFRGMSAEYAQLVLMSPSFIDFARTHSYGVKMPRLGTADGASFLVPVPPIAEQNRIVKRIAEYGALTNR